MAHLTVSGGEIDLTAVEEQIDDVDLLGAVAVALGSTLELREVLSRLARIGRDATGARHCSVFLLEGRTLVPTVAIGHRHEDDTWRAFKSMGRVRLDERRWEALAAGEPVALADSMASDLLPEAWKQQFRPGAVVLAPLMAGDEPCGLLAVDWPEPRSFGVRDLSTLGAIGTAAGVAVHNARLFGETRRRARLQEALTRAAAALVAPLDPQVIASRLVDAYTELIETRLCAIGLLDAERSCITTVASRGPQALEGPIPVSDIPRRVVSRAWRSWEEAKEPIEFVEEPWFDEHLGGREAGAGWYLLSPVVVEGHTRGCVLLGFEADRHLDVEEREAVVALAGMAGAAVERSVLLERRDRRARRLDALYRVSAALTERSDADTMVAVLGELLHGHGIEVDSVAFRDQRLAERLGADRLSAAERRVIDHGDAWEGAGDGVAVVPMRLGRRLFGVLRVRPARLDAEERAFLELLARDLAEVAQRDDLRARVEEGARERALAAERDRIASDLHDTAGQAFVAVGLLARNELEDLDPDDRWCALLGRVAELADRGKWDIDHATRALAFAPAVQRGLVPSLRSLAADVQADSGIAVEVAVHGEVRRLDPGVERALYRVAHEAIANAWRHARCSSVGLVVEFGAEVVLRVADDGVGAPAEFVEGRGLEGMRRALKECDGVLAVRAAEGGGTAVEARVPGGQR